MNFSVEFSEKILSSCSLSYCNLLLKVVDASQYKFADNVIILDFPLFFKDVFF